MNNAQKIHILKELFTFKLRQEDYFRIYVAEILKKEKIYFTEWGEIYDEQKKKVHQRNLIRRIVSAAKQEPAARRQKTWDKNRKHRFRWSREVLEMYLDSLIEELKEIHTGEIKSVADLPPKTF